MVKNTSKPCVVAGDFNMLWGEREIDLFLAASGLKNANTRNLPTFPSNQPRRHLDFVLHSKEIEVVDFQVPAVPFSDHLPVVVDFNVKVAEEHRSEQRPPHCSCQEKQNQLFGEAIGIAS
jgi:endonuclease/exonuclease/phosphatase family metal-dependent hydrolase